MESITFRAVVEQGGKTATGIPVPEEVIARLGSGKRPKIMVTLGDHTYRSTVGVMGGRSLIPLSAENRTAAGVAAGDEVDVSVQLDTAPRVLELPADLTAALELHPRARAAFDALSYSNRRRYVLGVEGAKAAETRQRRIDKAIAELSGG